MCAPIRWAVVDGLSCDSTPFLWCLPKETVSSRQRKALLTPPHELGGPARLSHSGVSPNGTNWCVKLDCGWLVNWSGKVSLTQSAVMLGLRVRGRGGRDRTATVAAPKSAFLWGSTPFLCARAKKWGGTGRASAVYCPRKRRTRTNPRQAPAPAPSRARNVPTTAQRNGAHAESTMTRPPCLARSRVRRFPGQKSPLPAAHSTPFLCSCAKKRGGAPKKRAYGCRHGSCWVPPASPTDSKPQHHSRLRQADLSGRSTHRVQINLTHQFVPLGLTPKWERRVGPPR